MWAGTGRQQAGGEKWRFGRTSPTKSEASSNPDFKISVPALQG